MKDNNSLSNLTLTEVNTTRADVDRKRVHNPKQELRLAGNRIRSLFVSGLSQYAIHKETGFDISLIKRTIKKVKAEIEAYDKHILLEQLKLKILSMSDTHTLMASELLRHFYRALEEEDLKGIVVIGRELSRVDKDFAQVLSLMGVSHAGSSDSPLTSTQGPTNNKILEIDYEEVEVTDVSGIRDEARKSMARMGQYLDVVDDFEGKKAVIVKQDDGTDPGEDAHK